jgi:hypothetical protein
MSKIVSGFENILKLVSAKSKEWGLNMDEKQLRLAADVSGIETLYQKMSIHTSGNGTVFGTWQNCLTLCTGSNSDNNLILKMKAGKISGEHIPKAAQEKMVQEWETTLKQYGGNVTNMLKNEQDMSFLVYAALQAENKQVHGNMGVKSADIDAYMDRNPKNAFAITYIRHQTPPKDGSRFIAGVLASEKDPAVLQQPLSNFISPAVQKSNPKTYKGCDTLGEALNKISKEGVNSTTAAAASAGVTVPTSESISTLVADLTAHNEKALAEEIKVAEKLLREQKGSEKEQKETADAISKYKKHVNDLFAQVGVVKDDRSMHLALNAGSYTAAAIMKADDKTLLKDIKPITVNGKEVSITPASLQGYITNMKTKKLIPDSASYETMTVGQLKEYESNLYSKDVQNATTLNQKANDNTLSADEKKRMDFMAAMTQMMSQDTSGFMSIIVALIGLMANTRSDAGQSQQQGQGTNIPAEVKTQATNAAEPLVNKAPATPVTVNNGSVLPPPGTTPTPTKQNVTTTPVKTAATATR